LLKDLEVWGMERGGLEGTIPTEVGALSNLIFIDLDFNALTGSITSQLLSLTKLEQLDLNNNAMTGSINGIGVYPSLTFVSTLHSSFNLASQLANAT
jgi:Leucine-rich repeat (LRR) protein